MQDFCSISFLHHTKILLPPKATETKVYAAAPSPKVVKLTALIRQNTEKNYLS